MAWSKASDPHLQVVTCCNIHAAILSEPLRQRCIRAITTDYHLVQCFGSGDVLDALCGRSNISGGPFILGCSTCRNMLLPPHRTYFLRSRVVVSCTCPAAHRRHEPQRKKLYGGIMIGVTNPSPPHTAIRDMDCRRNIPAESEPPRCVLKATYDLVPIQELMRGLRKSRSNPSKSIPSSYFIRL
jgi:hypothetical protein